MAHSGKLGKKKAMGWWVSLVDPESNGKQSVTSTDERQAMRTGLRKRKNRAKRKRKERRRR